MIKTARQLKDLIRNLSKNKSADAQILLRNYMMERFLERISLSEYRDKFILKGGMLVAAMIGLDARSTMDIDATVKGATVGIEEVENMIASIISVPVDDGVEFRVKHISEIMDEAEYPGIRVSMETKFDGVITPLKIDISTGDAMFKQSQRQLHHQGIFRSDAHGITRLFSLFWREFTRTSCFILLSIWLLCVRYALVKSQDSITELLTLAMAACGLRSRYSVYPMKRCAKFQRRKSIAYSPRWSLPQRAA